MYVHNPFKMHDEHFCKYLGNITLGVQYSKTGGVFFLVYFKTIWVPFLFVLFEKITGLGQSPAFPFPCTDLGSAYLVVGNGALRCEIFLGPLWHACY